MNNTRVFHAFAQSPHEKTKPNVGRARMTMTTAGAGRTFSLSRIIIGAALAASTASPGAVAETASGSTPPPVPHTIEGYKLGASGNDCLTCHAAPANAAAGARAVSDDHYVHRDGARLDKILATRVYCNQCHIPAAGAKPLPAEMGARHD